VVCLVPRRDTGSTNTLCGPRDDGSYKLIIRLYKYFCMQGPCMAVGSEIKDSRQRPGSKGCLSNRPSMHICREPIGWATGGTGFRSNRHRGREAPPHRLRSRQGHLHANLRKILCEHALAGLHWSALMGAVQCLKQYEEVDASLGDFCPIFP
jgi:hypothetical protein